MGLFAMPLVQRTQLIGVQKKMLALVDRLAALRLAEGRRQAPRRVVRKTRSKRG